MRTVELVVHCWRYSRALNYLLSSLVLNPPKKVEAIVGVYFDKLDFPTIDVLKHFDHMKPTPIVVWHCLPLPSLLNRSIGRNAAAKHTSADLVWFLDSDYFFGPGCLDALADVPLRPADPGYSPLYYPRVTYFNATKESGDAYSDRAATPGVYDIDPADFIEHRPSKAIGGIQIVPGDVARKYGYCDGHPRHLEPVTNGRWQTTRGDTLFRKILGTSGKPIDLPHCYRIRQSVEGEVDVRSQTKG